MATLPEKLEAARNEVARLELEAKHATCAEVGHRWKLIGGRNCGCSREDCEPGDGACSVLVYGCESCGDCDYGDNAESDEIRAKCDHEKELRPTEEAGCNSDTVKKEMAK